MKQPRPITWGLLALLVAVPAALTADDCSANCDRDGEWGCPGGCAISAPGNCGAFCFDGYCSGTCMTFGPGECRGGGSLECDPAPETGDRSNEDTFAWAALRLDPDGRISLLAASSRRFADRSAERAHESPGIEWLDAASQPWETMLFARPIGGRCVRPLARLGRGLFPRTTSGALPVYFSGRTDGSGKLLSVEVLYSPYPRAARRLVEFALENLSVWSDEVEGPFHTFGYLVALESGEVGYVLSGAAPAG